MQAQKFYTLYSSWHMIFLVYFPIGEKSTAELIKLFEVKLDFPLQKAVWRQVFEQRDMVQKKGLSEP